MTREELEREMDRITKRAVPHPDDTFEDRKRDLYHIQSIAASALKAMRAQPA